MSKPETYEVYLNNTKPMRYDFLDMVRGNVIPTDNSLGSTYI